ncbi:MAG: hypothetical protein ACRDPC_14500 [Solirubrobacteraceae bacterium]
MLAAIALTVFDDARDALFNRYWIDVWTSLMDAGLESLAARRVTNTIFMAWCWRRSRRPSGSASPGCGGLRAAPRRPRSGAPSPTGSSRSRSRTTAPSPSTRDARRSQHAMLALMVGFTLLALALISELVA